MPLPAAVSIMAAGPSIWIFQSNSSEKNCWVRDWSRHPISKCTTGRPIHHLRQNERDFNPRLGSCPLILNELDAIWRASDASRKQFGASNFGTERFGA